MRTQKSFERAVLDGDIHGPEWGVVNEVGQRVDPGNQDFGHTRLGRSVRLSPGGIHFSSVIDYQHPADTPSEQRDPEVGYESSAQDPRFRDA